MSKLNQPFFLCSGFHRSGTSLIANALLQNGVNMGERLMGASYANPAGHVEDLDMVEIHDTILRDNGTDWRYAGDKPLTVKEEHFARMQAYARQRNSLSDTNGLIGAKDPRAVLFIDSWRHAFSGHLKSILVFRDWRLSVSSLLKRHSRSLLNYASPMQSRAEDFEFWLYPDFAALMWLHAAQRMIHQATHAPADTLLFEQRAFVNNNVAVCQKASDKQFPASLLTLQDYRDELMGSSVDVSVVDMISNDTMRACDDALHRLNYLADVSYTKPVSVTRPSQAELQFQTSLTPYSPLQRTPFSTHIKVSPSAGWADNLKVVASALESKGALDWNSVFALPDLTPKKYEEIYVKAFAKAEFAAAELAMFKALQIKEAPWRWMHLGDLYVAQHKFFLARECFQKAQEMDDSNPTFIARLAGVDFYEGNIDEGIKLLEKAEAANAENHAVKNARALLSNIQTRTQTSGDPVAPRPGLMPEVTRLEDVVEVMSRNPDEGRRLDKRLVRSAFLKRDNPKWLADGLRKLSPSSARNLLSFLLKHLSKELPLAAMQTELTSSLPAFSQYIPAFKGAETGVKIGVHIHVYYIDLLPEIFDFLSVLPPSTTLVITCKREFQDLITAKVGHLKNVMIRGVINRGRDIAPWLIYAAPLLSHCDFVLKVHTKSTLHASHLSNWRLQLLWSLCGSENQVEAIIQTLASNPHTGLIMPDYLPALAPDLTWGKNKALCSEIAKDFNLRDPDDLPEFPAGSMFWYRPKALAQLTSYNWEITDFPTEEGQTDGTVMHALERMLTVFVEQQGYTACFTQDCV